MIKAVDLSCREGKLFHFYIHTYLIYMPKSYKIKFIIKINKGSAIYAPFDGELSPWRPFGENVKNQGECKPNQGARIDGHGQWQG